MGEAVAIHVLTGFLGAGKTTLLNRALRKETLSNTAIIVNEFGDIAIDHLLIEKGGDDVIELANGCLCCTVRGDFAEALERIAQRTGEGMIPIDRIIIETTGLADPVPVIRSIGVVKQPVRPMALAGVTTAISAVNGLGVLAKFEEAAAQVRLADNLVITADDLDEGTDNIEELTTVLRRLNKHAPLVAAHADDFDAASLFEDPAALQQNPMGEELQDAHRHNHHHEGRFDAVSIVYDKPVSARAIAMFCDLLLSMPDKPILRMKGIVETVEDPDRPLVIQAAGGVLHPFQTLPALASGARGARIVVIGDDLDGSYIRRMFNAFAGEIAVDTPDRAAITDNPLAIPGFKT